MATPLEDRSQNYCYFTSASNPLRLVPEMSYKVSSGTLNSAIRAHYLSIVLLAVLMMMMMMMIPYHQLHRSLHLTIFGVPASLYLSTLWIAAVGGECPCNWAFLPLANFLAFFVRYIQNKNLAIANRSRVSCAHNTSTASRLIVTPWPGNWGEGSLKVIGNGIIR